MADLGRKFEMLRISKEMSESSPSTLKETRLMRNPWNPLFRAKVQKGKACRSVLQGLEFLLGFRGVMKFDNPGDRFDTNFLLVKVLILGSPREDVGIWKPLKDKLVKRNFCLKKRRRKGRKWWKVSNL